MSLWTCEKCNTTVRLSQKSGHKAYRCPKQGAVLAAAQRLEKKDFTRGPQCWCGCGGFLDIRPKQKPKHFMDTEHYERWRAARRTQAKQERATVTEEAAEALESEREQARLQKEMEPILVREQEARVAFGNIRLLSPDESFALWMRCLGIETATVAVQ